MTESSFRADTGMDFRNEMILDAVSSGKGFDDIRAEMIREYVNSMAEGSRIAVIGMSKAMEMMLKTYSESLNRHRTIHVYLPQDTDGPVEGVTPVSVDEALALMPDKAIVVRRRNEYMDMAGLLVERGVPVVVVRDMAGPETVHRFRERVYRMIEGEMADHVAAVQRITEKKPTVCLAMFHMFPHYVKLVTALKNNGFSVVLFTGYPFVMNTKQPMDETFDYLVVSRLSYGLELDHILSTCRFEFLHIVADMSHTLPIALAVENGHCPVITDYNDFKQIVFRNEKTERQQACLAESEYRIEKKAQSHVFLRSSGIVYKDSPDVVAFLEKHYGQPVRSLSFKPYCSWTCGESVVKDTSGNRPIRVVYAGGLPVASKWHTCSVGGSILETIEKLTSQGIAFTVYNATDTSHDGFETYMKLAEEIDLFEYRKALPYDDLVREIKDHNFGLHCYNPSVFQESGFFLNTSFPSKVFTYLDAGLPVIVNREFTYVADYVEENGLGIAIGFQDLGRLKDIVDEENVRKMMNTIGSKREQFSFRKRFCELMDFYNESQRIWRKAS